ncbi:GTPase, partial [Vibrio sp. S457-15]
TGAKVFSKLSRNGELPIEVLDIGRVHGSAASHIEVRGQGQAHRGPEVQWRPGEEFIREETKGQGYFSCGWLFGAEYKFDFDRLYSMLSGLTAERVRSVVNNKKRCYAFNVANRVVSVNESNLEVIDS